MDRNVMKLGKRATACNVWRWMNGMRIVHYVTGAAGTVLEGGAGYAIWEGEGATQEGGGRQEQRPPHRDLVPDLRDAATCGCLLELVERLSLGQVWCTPARYSPGGDIDADKGWEVWRLDPMGATRLGNGVSPAAALVSALERVSRRQEGE